jgi:peptide/nickel transport system ATP-binding protein
MAAPLLEIAGLTVALPPGGDRPHAIEDVGLTLVENEILCVVGESGSGKSVMARSILGLLPPRRLITTAGEVRFRGENLIAASPARLREVRGAEIAMIFQEPMAALNPIMTIGRQIDEVVATHLALPRAERRRRALELFQAVHLPDPATIIDAYPHQLSGGQRQRAMIAMALILEPAIIIADEPTTALDVTTQAQILALIHELRQRHRAGILFITHDFGVVAEIADRVAVMQQGRLVEVGSAEQVLNAPQHPYTRALIAAVPSLTPPPARRFDPDAVLLSLDRVDKSYPSRAGLLRRGRRVVHAVKAASLSLRRGETLGLVGESGSGKSTLARCIVRLIEADRGAIRLGDVDLLALSRATMRPYRKRLQMIFQDPFGSLNPRTRVAETIAAGPMLHGTTRADALARARELLDLVGLDPRAADRFPHEFSGGQRQRIGLARALALQPDILIADEPLSALDVSIQGQILELLAAVRERLQLSMLFITHDLRVAAQVCDSIAVMREGEIVEYGPTARIFAAPSHAYTRELLAAIPGKAWRKQDMVPVAAL